MCLCATEIETTGYFLLYYHSFSSQRFELCGIFQNINSSFLSLNVKYKVLFLLYVSPTNTDNFE